MKKGNRSVVDLFKNEEFVRWVKNPTEESNHFWNKWIATNEAEVENVQIARRLIQSGKLKMDVKLSEEVYDNTLVNIMSYGSTKSQKPSRSLVTNYTSIAAAVALFLLCSVLLYTFSTSKLDSEEQISDNYEFVSKEAPLGSKVKTRLPDGTMVSLNSGASISYSTSLADPKRRVSLKGEAFFDVKRDESRPFIVETEALHITVLGTSFLVNADNKEKKLIGVMSGRVLVNNTQSKQAVVLNPGEAVSALSNGQFDFQIIEDDEMVFGWLDQKLVFKNSTLEEVLLKVKKWYGITFEMDEKFSSKILYTAKHNNPTLKEVLENLSHVYNFKYQIDGKIVTLK